MKNPILAGVLNVIVPGVGMAYLGKWKDGLALFFIAPFFAFFGKSIVQYLGYPYLKEIEATSLFASALITTTRILWMISLVCLTWILFYMAYQEAKGTLRKNPTFAIMLNFISAGLGFVYLKKWWLSIGTFLWVSIFLELVSNSSMTEDNRDIVLVWAKFLILFLVSVYLYWGTSRTAYREAKKINKGHETKVEGVEPQALTSQSN